MTLGGTPIKRKITRVIMLTSIIVLMLTVAAFMVYELTAFRENMLRSLTTLSQVVAEESSFAVMFKDEKDAVAVLAPLHAESQVVVAALYDANGKVFVTYPRTASNIPPILMKRGHTLSNRELIIYEPIIQEGKFVGTFVLKADLRLFYQRVKAYGMICALIVLGSVIVALVLSHRLQKGISDPILALAGTAKKVSEAGDYAVRATKLSDDETGLLTDAFNQMLTRIQEQTVAIQESETRKSSILESALDAIIGMDEQGRIVEFNPAAETLFGYQRKEALGKTVADMIVPEHLRERHWQGLKRFLATGDGPVLGRRIEMPALRSNGSRFTAELSISATRMQNGQMFFTAYLRDITERKRNEEASRRLAAIVESSADAIISKDLEGTITSWNAGAERMFGYPAAEAIGRSILIIIPEDHRGEETVFVERLNRGERIEHYDTVRRRKDGTLINISLTVSPIMDASGAIIGISKISRDITERMRSREALERQARTLREQAQMLDLANVMARDLEDRIIIWNTGMEKMYGWLRAETIGRLSYQVLQTRFPGPIEEIKATLFRDGQWEGELTHTRRDGSRIIVASQWILHKDEYGQPAAIIEVNTDVTERKRAEQQTVRMNIELERRVRERTSELTSANQELEAFTYSVAHDLRAPLRHIDAFAKILKDDFSAILPEEARHYLENIRKGSQNMSRLVDDLLNLARVGRQELRHEITPLNPIVDEVIADLKRDIGNRQVEWRIDKLPKADTDPGLTKQIFANLLANAVKYTRPRKKTIIEIGQQTIGDETVLFVRDNGVGFSMKYADKLFGVFQRLHRADEFEGTGVGLATVDRIVRRHGGRIWAEAEVDKGATFYFTMDGLNKPVPTAKVPVSG